MTKLTDSLMAWYLENGANTAVGGQSERLTHITEAKHAGMTPAELHRIKHELKMKWEDAEGNAGALARLNYADAYLARKAEIGRNME